MGKEIARDFQIILSHKGDLLGIYLIILCFLAVLEFSSRGATQELRKIHVAIPSVSPVATPFVVAKEKGYYREEGLEVELVVMRAARTIQALVGGNVDFSSAGGAGLPPVLRGAPIRFLFTTFNRPMFWLYAKPDIGSIKELKGKKVGVSSIGSGPDSLLRDLLKKHGLEGGREVTIMAIGEGQARYFALRAGSVDAAMIGLPAYFPTKEAGFRELFSFIKQEDLVGGF